MTKAQHERAVLMDAIDQAFAAHVATVFEDVGRHVKISDYTGSEDAIKSGLTRAWRIRETMVAHAEQLSSY